MMDAGVFIIVVTRLAVSSISIVSVVSTMMVTIGATVVVTGKVVVQNKTKFRGLIADLTLYVLFCFRENINIYLRFMSFLHTNETKVVEIPPRVRQGPAYST